MPDVGRLQVERFMKTILLLVFVISLSAVVSNAQTKAPRFDDYRVVGRFSGKPARVDLRSHPQARMFRTMLRDIAKKGPNYAGHYAVGYWGCGTECLRVGIVNLRTGWAYVSPFYASVGIAYRPDSNLLIVAPPEQIKELYGDAAPEYLHSRYYILKGSKLELIYPKSDIGDEAETYWEKRGVS
jgi:hypothetical protein